MVQILASLHYESRQVRTKTAIKFPTMQVHMALTGIWAGHMVRSGMDIYTSMWINEDFMLMR